MLIRPRELEAIRAGTVDLAFRRWDRPRVLVGTRLRAAVGLIEVTEIVEVDVAALTAVDATRAGAGSLDVLREALATRADRPTWRIGTGLAEG